MRRITFNPEFIEYFSKLWNCPKEMCEEFFSMFEGEFIEVLPPRPYSLERQINIQLDYKCEDDRGYLEVKGRVFDVPSTIEWYWKKER